MSMEKFRIAMMSAVTVEDVQMVMVALVEQAKAGNISAAKVVLERVVGPNEDSEIARRLEELESRIASGQADIVN